MAPLLYVVFHSFNISRSRIQTKIAYFICNKWEKNQKDNLCKASISWHSFCGGLLTFFFLLRTYQDNNNNNHSKKKYKNNIRNVMYIITMTAINAYAVIVEKKRKRTRQTLLSLRVLEEEKPQRNIDISRRRTLSSLL